MATINGPTVAVSKGTLSTTWSPMTQTGSDVGTPLIAPDYPVKTVSVYPAPSGGFGVGGAITIEGSEDLVNWFTLHDMQGTALVITSSNNTEAISETLVKYIRPRVTAGNAGTSLACTIKSSSGRG